MPGDISVVGYVEEDVLFSVCLRNQNGTFAFSERIFLLCVRSKSWPAAHSVNVVEQPHSRWDSALPSPSVPSALGTVGPRLARVRRG